MATTTVAAAAPERSQATPIWWPLRAWFAVEVAFGLSSITSIFFRPEATESAWAWHIQSVVMAAVLGTFYLASSVVFILPLFARIWQDIRAIVLPTAIFSSFMLLATFLHWDKFFVGSLPFAVWFASYVLPPPIFGFLYWWHQRRSAPPGTGITKALPRWVRRFLIINGVLFTIFAVAGFIFPTILQTFGPWPFTPLTARSLCGWLVAVGLGQLAMARENDWQRIKMITAMFLLLPFALLIQLLRYAGEVAWANPFLWVLILDTTFLAAVMGYLWAVDGGRERRPQPAME